MYKMFYGAHSPPRAGVEELDDLEAIFLAQIHADYVIDPDFFRVSSELLQTKGAELKDLSLHFIVMFHLAAVQTNFSVDLAEGQKSIQEQPSHITQFRFRCFFGRRFEGADGLPAVVCIFGEK